MQLGAIDFRQCSLSHAGGVATVLALSTVIVVGAWASPGPSMSAQADSPTTTVTKQTAKPVQSGVEALESAFVAVIAKVRPQVVQISTPSGLGSGVIFDTAGDIVTNAHVVGTDTEFTVHLDTGQQFPATLVGSYAPDDLAVIKVTGAKHLSPAKFANSDMLQVGDIVFAVGNPLGLASSVTEGIVSYNGRAVSEENGVVLPSTVQTSAAINPGNSGGALVNLQGQVIGVPTLTAADQQTGSAASGIGFAIPANTVKLIAPQLIATGHVTRSDRAALDVTAADAVDQAGRPRGAIVVGVAAGGSAAKAGITAGEVITSLGTTPVTSLVDLQTALSKLVPGSKVRVKLLDQDGTSRSVTATLDQFAE